MPFLALPSTPLSPRMPSSPAYLARGFRRSARGGRWPVVLAVLGVLALAEAAWYFSLWPHTDGASPLALSALVCQGLRDSSCGEAGAAAEGGDGTTHPVIGLMQDAEDRWLELQDRQSQTLEEAVAEYWRRYDRPPPDGFDSWFAWARAHDVVFVDEYDRLEPSIAAFGGISPARLRRSLEDFERENPTIDEGTRLFQLRIEGGECAGRGQDQWIKMLGTGRRSGWEFCEAIREIVHLIPDTPDLIYSTSDLGHATLSYEQLEHLRQRAKSGDRAPVDFEHEPYMDPALLEWSKETDYLTMALACPPDSPARRFHEDAISGQLVWDDSTSGYALPGAAGGFVHNASRVQDPCFNTELRKVAAPFLQWSAVSDATDNDGRPRTDMEPRFSQSKMSTQIDWLIPQLYEYPTMYDRLPDDFTPPPWEDREAKLIWRGKFTGVFYAGSHTIGGDWQESQRLRLHRQCNDDVGWEDYVYASPPADGSKLQHGSGLRRDLLGWYDCGLTTHADCGYDGCVAINRLFEGPGAPFSWKPLENHYERFKFVADVDGFGWSGRFRNLLRTGSVVFKATAFPEFFSDYLVPWYHYVPMKLDATDLPSLMAFFAGAPATHANAHDDLARAIGARGREFAARYWRKEDIQAWVWRTLLEYRRVATEAGPGELDFVA